MLCRGPLTRKAGTENREAVSSPASHWVWCWATSALHQIRNDREREAPEIPSGYQGARDSTAEDAGLSAKEEDFEGIPSVQYSLGDSTFLNLNSIYFNHISHLFTPWTDEYNYY